ncbi:MAG: thiol-disulfide oxidoreductase DCC family protein [Planctomycetaceae bacterium]
MSGKTLSEPRFEIFFDGDCPLCRREMEMWQRYDRGGRVLFTDITGAEFRPESTGLTWEQLMAELHGRLPTGEVTRGVETFRQLLLALDFRWTVGLSRLPGVRQVLDVGYGLFARNRLRLTGRCDTNCAVPQRKPQGETAA